MTWWASSTLTPSSSAMDLKMISGGDLTWSLCNFVCLPKIRCWHIWRMQGTAASPLCSSRHLCSVPSLLWSSISPIAQIPRLLLPQSKHGFSHCLSVHPLKRRHFLRSTFYVNLIIAARDPVLMGPWFLWGCSGLCRPHALEGQVKKFCHSYSFLLILRFEII